MNKFSGKITTLFNKVPLIVPVPDDPNLDQVPVVQLQSDSPYTGNLSRRRATISFAGQGTQSYSDTEEDFISTAKDFLAAFIESNTRIARIGFVTNFFYEEKESGSRISKLVSSNLTAGQAGVTRDAHVRLITRSHFDSFDYNNLSQIASGTANIIIDGKAVEMKGIIVTRDFNTIPEEDYSGKIDPNSLERIVRHGVSSFGLDTIESSLWPEIEKE